MYFTVTPHFDENDYPESIQLTDDQNLIGTYRRPLQINMLELERIYDQIEPLVKAYRKWLPKHEQYMNGERKRKPRWPTKRKNNTKKKTAGI